MSRETKEIVIDAHPFVVKTYATAREVKAIQACYLKGSKVEIVGDEAKINDFNTDAVSEVEKATIREMVVAFGGSTNIVEDCLDLPNEVYTELVAQLDAIVSKKKS